MSARPPCPSASVYANFLRIFLRREDSSVDTLCIHALAFSGMGRQGGVGRGGKVCFSVGAVLDFRSFFFFCACACVCCPFAFLF